ncbi:hypothetical protein RP20_CCG000093 [Aedes albopictus]|nr:hypothetical protein RP20_CCG000093 [Aedes albopictus]
MSDGWGTSVTTIPHVFEHIFSFLDFKDLQVASEVCRQWEAAVFGSRQLSGRMAWNILKPVNSQKRKKSRLRSATHRILRTVGLRKKGHYATQELLDMERVLASTRLLDGVVMAPRGSFSGDWTNVMVLLMQINRQYPINWMRIDGSYEEKIISPQTLVNFGSILGSLRHLELTLTLNSFFQPNWIEAFEEFSNLESLILNNGHLEELVIEDLDIFPWFIGESQVVVPNLKSLTMCMLMKIDTEELNIPAITIKAPLLEEARFSDVIQHFVRLESIDCLRKFTLCVSSSPGSFISPRMFHGRLINVTVLVIETRLLRGCHLVMALAWVKQQCPRASTLVFVQQEEPPLEQIRSFAAAEIPHLKQIEYRRPPSKAKSLKYFDV